MKLTPYFNLKAGKLLSEARNKDEMLNDIVASALQNENLCKIDAKLLFNKLKERESIGSTGFGGGIAIPHCTLDNIDSFVIGAMIAPDGANFSAIDGEPVKLFIYIVAPSKRRNEHIRILSEISKVLREPANVQQLLAVKDTKSFFNTFSQLGNWDSSEDLPEQYAQITVHIQDANAFNGILEIFSERKACYMSIIEANNAGKYLYALPLFSHFMNEEQKGFHRLILAVINTVYINETVRKIQTFCEENKCANRVLVTTQSLNYYNGSIDI
jgi:nitrogen PTS system EIIA component